MYTFLFLSGGTGSRMQNTVPKQYMLLAGKPMIMHILERIDTLEVIKEVIIVCTDEYRQSIELMLQQYGIRKPVRYARAGATRQESVRSGLALVGTEYVVVHEAARPFVKTEDFQRLIAEENPNAIFGLDIPFTVIKGHENVEDILDRSSLVNVQLPQKFQTQLLRDAHGKAAAEGLTFTEDAGVVYHYNPNVKIKICRGMDYNLKITTRIDMVVGEQIYDDIFRRRK